MNRVAPSARLEEQIAELLANRLGEEGEHLAELGRLGARLVLQRAIDEEVTAFLWPSTLPANTRSEGLAQRHAAEADPDRRR